MSLTNPRSCRRPARRPACGRSRVRRGVGRRPPRRPRCRGPGASGICQKPSTLRIGPRTTSKYQGTAPTISSWITWLGVEIAKWSAATPAMGPSGLCGATPTETASAMAAIFLASSSPPQWQMSGWMMPTARAASRSWNSSRSTRRSPVASGTPAAGRHRLERFGLAGRHRLLDEHGAEGGERPDVAQCGGGTRGPAVEVNHHLDAWTNGTAQRLHHSGDLVDLGQRRMEMGVGNEHRLEGSIAESRPPRGPARQGARPRSSRRRPACRRARDGCRPGPCRAPCRRAGARPARRGACPGCPTARARCPKAALMPIAPSRQKLCFFTARTACSMSRGSRPISSGARSSTAPTTARVFHSSVASPQPNRPGSSVSTRTKTQLRISAIDHERPDAGDLHRRRYPVIDCRRTRRSMIVCSTTDSTMTRPKQSWV